MKPYRSVSAAIVLTVVLACLSPAAFGQTQTQTLSLPEFIALVEQYSLDLETARTSRSLAEVQERIARSQLYPTIAGQLGYTRNLLDLEQPVPTDNTFLLGVSLQQKLFDMAVFQGLDASREYSILTETAFQATREAVITEAKRLFFQTLLLAEVLAVRRSSEEIAHDSFLDVENRFRSGLVSRIEVLTAEVNWKITQPNTSQSERNLQIALQNLKNLAGLPLDAELQLTGSLESFPPPPEDLSPSAVQARRPDYQVLLNQRRLRELAISAKRSAFYPSLSASIDYGWQAASNEFDLSESTDALSVGLGLTVPILYGGGRFPMLRQAQLELAQTETQISKKEADIYTELENIHLTLLEADQRIGSAEQTVETAQEAYDITRSSVETGLATQLQLKDARVSLEQARLGYLSAVFDYLSAYFDWQRATGRGAELP